LIERLLQRYPQVIAGAKDSSGDWSNSRAMIDNYAAAGFDVFPASEVFLSCSLPLGGAGCISATVNMNPAAIRRVYDAWNTPEGPELQARADVVRRIFESAPMIPAMKHVVSTNACEPRWRTVRPPLVALAAAVGARISAELAAAGFAMPGYPRR
jgi:4-hydroxy-tetrahydrodipicolinate synthase